MQSVLLLQQSTGKHVHVAFRALGSRKTCKTNRLRASAASLVTTPHSGYHFDNTNRRFFEGWYFKVTLPGEGNAFAFIYSVEDPGGGGENGGVGAQIMGPENSYLLQYSSSVDTFWAEGHALELGATFTASTTPPKSRLPKEVFNSAVIHGYQASQTWHQGSLIANETGASGTLPSTVKKAKWAFSVQPLLGWGEKGQKQKATAGWLASLPVFEPHWQVMMALGSASGWIEWGDQRFEFDNASAYAEKNWGGGFPKRWFWIQCESFDSPEDQEVALTSVGAKRGLLNVRDEEVGLVGLHWEDRFFEFVPQNGEVKWEVQPWGSWQVWADNGSHKVKVEATCEQSGTPLRAPTADSGLSPLCKDSFHGKVKVSLWEKGVDSRAMEADSRDVLILEATSTRAAVEVGGGPWWDPWRSEAKMQEPFKSLVKLPINVEGISARLPQGLRPKGL